MHNHQEYYWYYKGSMADTSSPNNLRSKSSITSAPGTSGVAAQIRPTSTVRAPTTATSPWALSTPLGTTKDLRIRIWRPNDHQMIPSLLEETMTTTHQGLNKYLPMTVNLLTQMGPAPLILIILRLYDEVLSFSLQVS